MSSGNSVREHYTQLYWVASRQWRGDTRFGDATMGSIIQNLVNIAGGASRVYAPGLEGAAATLLDQVVKNKRCRKRKSPQNVVFLQVKRDEIRKRLMYAELYSATSETIERIRAQG